MIYLTYLINLNFIWIHLKYLKKNNNKIKPWIPQLFWEFTRFRAFGEFSLTMVFFLNAICLLGWLVKHGVVAKIFKRRRYCKRNFSYYNFPPTFPLHSHPIRECDFYDTSEWCFLFANSFFPPEGISDKYFTKISPKKRIEFSWGRLYDRKMAWVTDFVGFLFSFLDFLQEKK